MPPALLPEILGHDASLSANKCRRSGLGAAGLLGGFFVGGLILPVVVLGASAASLAPEVGLRLSVALVSRTPKKSSAKLRFRERDAPPLRLAITYRLTETPRVQNLDVREPELRLSAILGLDKPKKRAPGRGGQDDLPTIRLAMEYRLDERRSSYAGVTVLAPSRPLPPASPRQGNNAPANGPPGVPVIASVANIVPPQRRQPPTDGRPDSFAANTDRTSGDNAQGGGLISGWEIPPIRWGGAHSYGYTTTRSGDGARSTGQSLMTTVSVSSFIYQPWYALVSGSLGIARNVQASTAPGTDGISGTDNRSVGTSVTGGGVLQMFPASRFPFVATLDRSDSTTAGGEVQSGNVSTRLGLRQSYRPVEGTYNLSGGFDHSTVVSIPQGGDTVNAFSGTYSSSREGEGLNVDGRVSQSEQQTGNSSQLINLSARRNFIIGDTVRLDANSYYNDNTLNYGSDSGPNSVHGRFLQLGATGTWRPQDEDGEDLPLSVNGTLMMFDSQTQLGSTTVQSRSLMGNASTYYTYSPHLTFTGGGGFVQQSTSGTSVLITTMNGGASYTGSPLTFGKFSYFWGGGANLNYQGGGANGANHAQSGSFNHSLSRGLPLWEGHNLFLTAAQTASLNQDQRRGSTQNLSHSAGGTWSMQLGERASGNVNLNLTDSVSQGATESHSRFLNLSLMGNAQASHQSALSANLGFMWSTTEQGPGRQSESSGAEVMDKAPVVTKNFNTTGSATYRHNRAFGISGLRYGLTFTASGSKQEQARLLGDTSARPDNSTRSLENRFDYRIGLLTLRTTGTINNSGGRKNALLFFQAIRQFGGY